MTGTMRPILREESPPLYSPRRHGSIPSSTPSIVECRDRPPSPRTKSPLFRFLLPDTAERAYSPRLFGISRCLEPVACESSSIRSSGLPSTISSRVTSRERRSCGNTKTGRWRRCTVRCTTQSIPSAIRISMNFYAHG